MLKITWADLLLLTVGMIAGNVGYEYTKDYPNWVHVLDIAWYQTTAFVSLIIFTKIFGSKE